MKYLVKFYVKHESTTGNVEYSLKRLEESSCKYSKIETKPIKEFGEELTLIIAYEEISKTVEASDERTASLTAIENYVGHKVTEILSVTPAQEEAPKKSDEKQEQGIKFIVENFYGQAVVYAKNYSEAVNKFESSSRRKAAYITICEDNAPVKFVNDAENLLFEMDANECDELIIKEGFGSETVVTRDEVERFLKLQNSSKRITREKALSGDYDTI